MMDLLNIQEGASRPSLISSIWSLQVQLQNETNPMTLDMPILFSSGGSQQSLPGALNFAKERVANYATSSSEMLAVANHHAPYSMNVSQTCAQTQNFRSVKSLSDLKSLVTSSSMVLGGYGLNVPVATAVGSPLVPNVSPLGQYAPNSIAEDERIMAEIQDVIPSTSAACQNQLYTAQNSNKVEQTDYQYGSNVNNNGDNTVDRLPFSYRGQMLGGGDYGGGFCAGFDPQQRIYAPAFGGISRQQRNNNICQWLQKLSLSTPMESVGYDSDGMNGGGNAEDFSPVVEHPGSIIPQANMTMEVESHPQ